MTDRRAKFRDGLSLHYLPFYDALCEELSPYWQPYSGLRTPEKQDELYAQGRTAPGGIVTNAKGGESAHQYGCANDWTLWDAGGNPIWMKKTDLRWQSLIMAAEKVGLRSGSEFGDVDHTELRISLSWKNDILPLLRDEGMSSAQLLIKSCMI